MSETDPLIRPRGADAQARSRSRLAELRTQSVADTGLVDAKLAVDLATHEVRENVYLFVPNLIGYTRILLAALSLHFMPYHPRYCTVLYCLSCLLDAFDGMAARALNQSTKFGAVLDMVTDRCTTACLLCFLSSAYPSFATVFQFLITLDFSSHYMHMYSSLTTGSKSHKLVTSDVSWVLSVYYTSQTVLFICCAGNELFFVALYLMHFDHTAVLNASSPKPVIAYLSTQVINLLTSGGPWGVYALSYLELVTWAAVMALAFFPIAALKNFINAVQWWKASKILVGVDLVERARQRQREARGENGSAGVLAKEE
ncbi:hypothetical protein DACRYDRAFT_74661 [Dacryopinax primogenitus]|uniref:CDP-diacylglycerol--inositol 3-phosphatidyltransferase n=1 Tax=Dacryopinax primogenitus (strain DJM 731) TaxID=1858805 RepID=M5GGG5_DACPD|nr:uncharacterized protein DACRYDRAFT_74661 [Dacryopinax primogenitus]EJU05448.1 hypothetical protein DACRYDRAFT_74661 [Dacryopinax primogenitus]